MSLITCTFEKVRMDLITGKAIRKVSCLPHSRGEVLVDLEDVTPLTNNAKELVRLYRKDEDSPEGTEYLNELLSLAVRSKVYYDFFSIHFISIYTQNFLISIQQHFIASHIAFALASVKRSNAEVCLSLPYSEGDRILMQTKEGKSLGTVIMPTSEKHYAVRLDIDNQIRQRVKTSTFSRTRIQLISLI